MNQKREEYKIWEDNDEMGLVVCTDLSVTNPENFIDPKQNQSMY